MCGLILPSSLDKTAVLKAVLTDFTGLPLNSTKCCLAIPLSCQRRRWASRRGGRGTGGCNVLRERFHRHFTNPRCAAFAFLLARKKTGFTQRSYKKGSGLTRAELMKDLVFKAAFDDAKSQMKEMDYRCVEETDPTKQALLEIYCATVLGAEHNDFDNH